MKLLFIENIMKNSGNEVEISFRLLNLDKFQAYSLAREILGSSFSELNESGCYIGCIPLSEQTFEDINNYYVRQRV